MDKEVEEMLTEKLKEIAGADNVYDDPEILENYSKDHSFVPPRSPLAVVKLKSTDKIKEIIDLANETHISLIPVSSGFPKFHGDTIPTVPGVVIDLSGLDKVLRVDRPNRVAIIEPGVTFDQLRMATEQVGMVPYFPLLPRSTKSVLASFLEREPITIPKDHWDFNDPLAGGEVVIGDGHIQGFGDSAQFSKKEVEAGIGTPVIPMGPSIIGWLTMVQGAQGTLGIVPWVSIRCRIKPAIQRPFFVASHELKDLLPFLYKILRLRFVDELFIVNAFCLASILFEEPKEIEKYRANLPPWVLFLNIAGYERYPEEDLKWKENQMKEIAVLEGIELKSEVSGIGSASLLRSLGKAAEKDRRLRYKDSSQVLPFSTSLDKTPELTLLAARMTADYGFSSANMSIYIQPVIQGCQCDCEVILPYNPQNKKEVKGIIGLYDAMAQQLSQVGAYYSRPYDRLASISYKDTEVLNVLRKVKGILDPNDIMNSGKLY
jgi:hypothetical protein